MGLNDIIKCKYISSVGLLKSLDELNMVTYGDGIVDVAHRVTYDFSKILNGKDGICIYIKFEYISYFFNNIFPQINYKFILITGDGDETLPDNVCDINTFLFFINNEKIIHWYSTNCIENIHPKLTLIPIGVNFHSLNFGPFSGWNAVSLSSLEQESQIINIRDNSPIFYNRFPKCYSNFHFVTYEEFGNPRKDAIEKIDKSIVYYEPSFVTRDITWENQSKYAFVLSPMGHGMDCHRTWEALILGCIVIVKKSPLDSLYKELPVLIVDDWSDISEKLLIDTINQFKNIEFNYDRITTKYWVEKIKKAND